MKIQIWSQEEAEQEFNLIEKDKGKGEWQDIDWKRELNFDDTIQKRNTTQKAISGFANTYGGKLIIGIEDDGTIVGVKKTSDIENHIRRKLEKKISPQLPGFKVKEYKYKKKNILVIFLPSSDRPLQCDNGVYYYREQSEFLPMPHELLERKFREYFDEEKYLHLAIEELKHFEGYLKYLMNASANASTSFSFTPYTRILDVIGEKIYFFLKESNLLRTYFDLQLASRFLKARENFYHIGTNEARSVWSQVQNFQKSLREKAKEKHDIRV